MVKLLLLATFVNILFSQHRFENQKQTGFPQMLENLGNMENMNKYKNVLVKEKVKLACFPLCGMSATFHNLFTKKYLEQAFAYDSNKARQNMTKIIQTETKKPKQKHIKTVEQMNAMVMKNLYSKSTDTRRGLNRRFIRFS